MAVLVTGTRQLPLYYLRKLPLNELSVVHRESLVLVMNNIGVTLDEYDASAKPGHNDEILEGLQPFVGQLPHGLAASSIPSLFNSLQVIGTSASSIRDAEIDEVPEKISVSIVNDSDSGRESPELNEALANLRSIVQTQFHLTNGLSGDSSHGLFACSNSDKQSEYSPTTSPARKTARTGY